MIEATCHCGAVRLEVPRPPETLTECNCSICRRTGALLAYYPRSAVKITGATDTYAWGDRTIELHRCKVCGNFTHWLGVDPSYDRMGVNARMLPPEVRAAARVRPFDGAVSWRYLDEPAT